jgi:ABC-type Fe3+-citrate transport system substrate-binding protein
MKRLLTLCLLFAACNTQSKADLQKEYDAILVEQKSATFYINMYEDLVQSATMRGDITSAAQYQKVIDSFTVINKPLEKRRQELAQRLYK